MVRTGGARGGDGGGRTRRTDADADAAPRPRPEQKKIFAVTVEEEFQGERVNLYAWSPAGQFLAVVSGQVGRTQRPRGP